MSVRRFLPLAALCAMGSVLTSCQEKDPALGIDPEPPSGFIGRRLQVRLEAEKADMAVIFIGGFSEQVLTHYRAVYEAMPPLPGKGRQLRAYYAWDGARGNLLFHSTTLIQEDLKAFMRCNPEADIVLIGHSYGGSATMDVLRHIGADVPHGRVVVVTIDPVSKRERSKPRERAEGVYRWINVYCDPYRAVRDSVASVGGPWRHCPQADVNMVFSGKDKSSDGRHYQHSFPGPLFEDVAPGQELSAHKMLIGICHELSADKTE